MIEFIEKHLKRIKPLMKQVKLAYWEAAISGRSTAYDRYGKLELEIRRIYSNTEEFARLEKLKNTGSVEDRVMTRQLDVLYNAYLANQIEPNLLTKIVELETMVDRKFSTFRGILRGKKVTDNEIKEILKSETDSDNRKEAWLASKQVGQWVAEDLLQLIRLRNEGARGLGFDNYHSLSLTTAEQEVDELDSIFNQLDKLTRGPFSELKAELDGMLAKTYGVDPPDLMPWHYHDPFFQETPLVYDLDLDAYYRDRDVKEIAKRFYASLDLPVESILDRSDLYERDGKNPHAFCEDMDREGDVRILCNIKNVERWMETILHELGHGVYDLYHDPQIPYLLREPAHIFTTEAVAMFFGRLSRDAGWMQAMIGLSDKQRTEIEQVSSRYARLKQLIFARWAMVMYAFEKHLYDNPDQDLNALWWQTVKKYQLVNTPEGRSEPDWASKIHFASAPCYYHNYLLGELLASQMHHYIVQNIHLADNHEKVKFVNQKRVGQFFRYKIFKPGKLYHWNEMIEKATGDPLSARYFVEQFVVPTV